MKDIYSQIASSFQAYLNCVKNNNTEWRDKHQETIEKLVSDKLPSGSGFNNGTSFDFERSKPERLVFHTSYHHMNENGYYDGWTDHTVIVTPSLAWDFNLRITGRNRNAIKDCIAELFRR